MAIAYEPNTNLAFDTSVLEKAAKDYTEVAEDMREMVTNLEKLLQELDDEKNGWTTRAADKFKSMTDINWKNNIEKYATLLDTLSNILTNSVKEYDALMIDYVRTTQLHL